ncbi:hypothetical protein ACFHW2_25450 [Actinomadura sp. LOL_016]|uniref:hypothetical protein n=1 Tax=unclassified Actinomadura TaxID=2626254 RepID=UPI003A7FC1D3
MTLAPRAVVVHRRTEYEELLARHGSRGQAEFFLRSRGRDLAPVDAAHAATAGALARVAAAIPVSWRRGLVERADLDRFLFAPDDIVVVVGQDGLVANTAKYLDGQPVIGLDPDPGRNPGVLVPHPAEAWPSPATGTSRTQGRLGAGETLGLVSETDGLVVFGDGMESDRLTLSWGSRVEIGVAPGGLSLVR